MDYEKAYKQALERAKNLKEMYPQDAAGYEEVFPELRESEEEKIRKDIIGGLMWQRDNLKSEGPHDNNLILPGFCFTVGKHLTYLEKQKEQKPKNILTDDDSLQTAYLKGQTDVLEDPEAYGLQKERKPAWSEDDEANLDYLIDFCNSYYNGNTRTLTESVARSLSNWLYRVKSGEISLPKSRLDEKDEKTIHLACEFIRHHATKNDSIGGIDCSELVERLKSLRRHLKPTEEQMDALAYAIQILDDGLSPKAAKAGEELEHLREQLKQLI